MVSKDEGRNGITTIRPGRSLTAGNVETFQRTVRAELEEGRRRLLVDMGETEAVDSTGLGALVRLQRAAVDAGGRLALVSLRENSQILLRLTQLDGVLETYGSAAEAEEAFQRPRPEAPPPEE